MVSKETKQKRKFGSWLQIQSRARKEVFRKTEFNKMEMKRLARFMEQEMMELKYINQSLRYEAATTLRQNSHIETVTKDLQSKIEYLKHDLNTANRCLEQFKEIRKQQCHHE